MNLVMARPWPLEAVLLLLAFYPFIGSATNLDPAQEQIRLLNNGLRGIRDEQELLMIRETQHRQMAESTRRRVSWWFVIQTLLLGTVVFFQIWYMKRFFETRRVM